MPPGPRSNPLTIPSGDQAQVSAWSRHPKTAQAARIVLLARQGVNNSDIARPLGYTSF